jgi:CheY-like chemotaxis protein
MQTLPPEAIPSQSILASLASLSDDPEPSQQEQQQRGKQNGGHKKKLGNRLLMVGRIRELALYRAEYLRLAGFDVVIASDSDEAIRVMQRGAFDAIILSYTLPSDTVQYLAETARDYCPDCPVIAIAETNLLDRRIEPDAVALAEEGPTALLSALNRVLQLK